nr:low-density lipoprotein receptor-related protein 4-like [Lytechinus pictus]
MGAFQLVTLQDIMYALCCFGAKKKKKKKKAVRVNGLGDTIAITEWHRIADIHLLSGLGGREYSSVTIDEIRAYVFWTEPSTSRRVYRKATDGSSPTVIRYGVRTPRGLALRKATRRVYILMENRVDSRTLNLGGPTSPVSYPNNKNVKCLTLDEAGGMMYFIDFESDAVLKMAPIDGGKLNVVPLDIKDTPSGMLFASGWLVWLEPTHHRVGRVALRGSSREIIYQDFDEQMEAPASLAFIP